MILRKASFVAALIGAFALLAGGASAGGPAKTTIKLDDHSDVSGQVKSPRAKCVDERQVKLMRKRSGKDANEGMGTADKDGFFDFGNPGLAPGKTYYVKAPATPGCEKGKSATFVAQMRRG